MNFKNIFSSPKAVSSPPATASKEAKSDIHLKISQEYQDRSRKDIKKWREAITAAENPEDPRWYLLQDMIDDIRLDAHLSSVIDVRKAATLNHRFYVTDRKTGEKLDEQTNLLERQWFYEFLDAALDAIFRKYCVMQFSRVNDEMRFSVLPWRNVCPQTKRVYLEVSGDKYIDYSAEGDVIEMMHQSPFGLINDVAPNVIWKRNLMQANAEFSERFGMPLITATTSNKADVPKIEKGLKNLGEAGSGVLPNGTDIKVHALANAGNPEKVYMEPAKFHDNQVSKRFLGSTTMVDEGANRSQTEVHEKTLDDKISLSDKRMIMFAVVDQLFPIMQNFGLPFDREKMSFQFDETEDMSLSEQWKITSEALEYYDLDEQEIAKTFNLPIKAKKEQTKESFKQATSMLRAIAVASGINLPDYPDHHHLHITAAGSSKSLSDQLDAFDRDIAKYLWNDQVTEAERERLLKGKRIAEELREGLFSGWGDNRLKADWNAPDHHTLAAMEMNLFRFAEAKGRAELLLLNRLLIDREKNEIRSEADFIAQAMKINDTFNKTYLATERDFTIAVGQNSARYLEFFAEKDQISNWEYQTVGDDYVREEHDALDGRVFSFNDVEARRVWPPNGYKCRCEGIQYLGKPRSEDMMSGKDAMQVAYRNDKERKMFGFNRADAGLVFAENQMYLGTLKDESGKKTPSKPINNYTFADYGLKKWSELKDGLKPLTLDKTITPDNVKELFKESAEKGKMGYTDYLKRKITLAADNFKNHTKGETYIVQGRHQLFPHVADILNNPSEVYLRVDKKTRAEQIRYIRFYNDKSLVVDTEITSAGLEIKTWYENSIDDKIREGLLIK